MAHPYPHPASVVPEVDQAPLQVGPSQQGCWGLGTDELPFFYLPSSAPWPAGFQRALTVTQVTQALSHIGEKDGLGGENAFFCPMAVGPQVSGRIWSSTKLPRLPRKGGGGWGEMGHVCRLPSVS